MSDDPAPADASQRDRGNTPAPGPGWRVTPPTRGQAGGSQPGAPNPRRRQRWIIALLVLGALALNLWISSLVLQPNPRVRIPYSPTFLAEVSSGNVSAISSTNASIQGTFKTAVKYPSDEQGVQATKYFSTQIPSFANNNQLFSELKSQKVTINANNPDTGPSFLTSLIFGFGPTLLLVLLFVFLIRRAASAGGGAGGLMSFGRSRARRVEAAEQPVTFADVAGIDEAKDELTEIVDFLKNPDKYLRLGGRIPRGVLLSGAPGTGKTLLARGSPARRASRSFRCRPLSSSR